MSYCYSLRGRDVERLRQQLGLHADDRVVEVGEEEGRRKPPRLRGDLEAQIHCIQKLFQATCELRRTCRVTLFDAVTSEKLHTLRITNAVPILRRRTIEQLLKSAQRRSRLRKLSQTGLPTLHVIRISEIQLQPHFSGVLFGQMPNSET